MLALVNAGADARIRLDGTRLRIADSDGVEHAVALDRLPVTGGDDTVLEGRGVFDPPSTPLDANGQGIPYATYGFAAQIASVEVDLELGTVAPRRVVAAHDVGAAVNPTLVEGQIEGGIAQGIGLALMEEYIPGRTENLHDYLFPTVGDIPEIECLLVEDPEPLGPYGAKGIGEPALIRDRARDPQRGPSCNRLALAPAADTPAPRAGGPRCARLSWLRCSPESRARHGATGLARRRTPELGQPESRVRTRLFERLGSTQLSQISKAVSWTGGTRLLRVRRAGGSMEFGRVRSCLVGPRRSLARIRP